MSEREPRRDDARIDELACVDAQEEEFLRAGESVPPGDRVRLDRLDRAVRAAIGGGEPPRRAPRRSIVRLVIPALAAAAVLALFVLLPRDRAPEEPVFRGDAPGGALRIDCTVTQEDGRSIARFRWPALQGADAYAVLVLGADRSTVARLEVGGATSARWEIPRELRAAELECLVVASREGREVERSPVERLEAGAP